MCRPPGNRDPLPDEIEACKPWLTERIALIDPAVIVTLGNSATRFILGPAGLDQPRAGPALPLERPDRDPDVPPRRDPARGRRIIEPDPALRADFQSMKTALAERPAPVEEQLGALLMRIELRADAAEDTAGRPRASPALARPATPSRSPASWAPARPPSCRAWRAASGVDGAWSRRRSPSFASIGARLTRRPRRRLPARARARRHGPRIGRRAGRRRGRRCSSSGATPSRACCPTGHLVIELTVPGGRAGAAHRAVDGDGRAVGEPVASASKGSTDAVGGRGVIVLGIETSTQQTSVALGDEQGIVASVSVAGRARQDAVAPVLEQLLRWSGHRPRERVGGVAVGLGPGLFTGLRVGIETAQEPRTGPARADHGHLEPGRLGVRRSGTRRRRIGAVIDARRGEVFYAFYRSVPGGVVREGEHRGRETRASGRRAAGAVRRRCCWPGTVPSCTGGSWKGLGARVEFASPTQRPSRRRPRWWSSRSLGSSARKPTDSFDIQPIYLRKSDAEIAWDQRARGAPA